MSALPLIDVVEFARLEKSMDGEVAVSDLPRLQDLIVAGPEKLRYDVRGRLNARRQAQITCTIGGFVLLECQRCLGSFSHAVDIHSTLVFVADESELPEIDEEDESVDYLVADKAFDLLALIEDEVILGLPLAPRHKAGECDESPGRGKADGKPSPFAVLAKLKRSSN